METSKIRKLVFFWAILKGLVKMELPMNVVVLLPFSPSF
ncbi:hypothetical protein BVRB_1g002870 [Beta vulgaris subsp. vulgaris]|nr:hypothetical protein BVRB_1g002870 [Beta vulgaris subsp. vulgaris]